MLYIIKDIISPWMESHARGKSITDNPVHEAWNASLMSAQGPVGNVFVISVNFFIEEGADVYH